MPTIDLNADIGEGFTNDISLLNVITSANIACGGHAGDRDTIAATHQAAVARGVRTGAHPSYPDRDNFGRRSMTLTPAVITSLHGQIEQYTSATGEAPEYIKAHGALYSAATRDRQVADVLVAIALEWDVPLMGQSVGQLQRAANESGVQFICEVFADRRYLRNGLLAPRGFPRALISDPIEAASQIISAINLGLIPPVEGEPLIVQADSACVHGDGPHAVAIAHHLRTALCAEGIEVRA